MVGSTGVLSPAVVVTADVARPAVVVGPSGPACAGKGIAMTVAPSRAATASATTGRRRPVSEGCIIVNSLVNAELSQDRRAFLATGYRKSRTGTASASTW